MLKGISPAISPDLLKTLAEMGHGDEIVISDAHFPGHTFNPRVIRARRRKPLDVILPSGAPPPSDGGFSFASRRRRLRFATAFGIISCVLVRIGMQ